MPQDILTVDAFAEKIKSKYPQYNDVDNYVLAEKMVEKYPQYKDRVDLKKKDDSVLPSSDGDLQSQEIISKDDLSDKKWDEYNKILAKYRTNEEIDAAIDSGVIPSDIADIINNQRGVGVVEQEDSNILSASDEISNIEDLYRETSETITSPYETKGGQISTQKYKKGSYKTDNYLTITRDGKKYYIDKGALVTRDMGFGNEYQIEGVIREQNEKGDFILSKRDFIEDLTSEEIKGLELNSFIDTEDGKSLYHQTDGKAEEMVKELWEKNKQYGWQESLDKRGRGSRIYGYGKGNQFGTDAKLLELYDKGERNDIYKTIFKDQIEHITDKLGAGRQSRAIVESTLHAYIDEIRRKSYHDSRKKDKYRSQETDENLRIRADETGLSHIKHRRGGMLAERVESLDRIKELKEKQSKQGELSADEQDELQTLVDNVSNQDVKSLFDISEMTDEEKKEEGVVQQYVTQLTNEITEESNKNGKLSAYGKLGNVYQNRFIEYEESKRRLQSHRSKMRELESNDRYRGDIGAKLKKEDKEYKEKLKAEVINRKNLFNAAYRMYKLNENPAGLKDNVSGGLYTLQGASGAFLSDLMPHNVVDALPPTNYDASLQANEILNEAGIELSDEDNKKLENSGWQEFGVGLGGLASMIAKFSVLDRGLKVAKLPQIISALKAPKYIKITNPKQLTSAYKSGKKVYSGRELSKAGAIQKQVVEKGAQYVQGKNTLGNVLATTAELYIEGKKFEAVGGEFVEGSAFAAAQKALPNLKFIDNPQLRRAIETIYQGGVGFAAASEVSSITSAVEHSIFEGDKWGKLDYEMSKLYGDIDETSKRVLTSMAHGVLLRGTHMYKDFKHGAYWMSPDKLRHTAKQIKEKDDLYAQDLNQLANNIELYREKRKAKKEGKGLIPSPKIEDFISREEIIDLAEQNLNESNRPITKENLDREVQDLLNIYSLKVKEREIYQKQEKQAIERLEERGEKITGENIEKEIKKIQEDIKKEYEETVDSSKKEERETLESIEKIAKETEKKEPEVKEEVLTPEAKEKPTTEKTKEVKPKEEKKKEVEVKEELPVKEVKDIVKPAEVSESKVRHTFTKGENAGKIFEWDAETSKINEIDSQGNIIREVKGKESKSIDSAMFRGKDGSIKRNKAKDALKFEKRSTPEERSEFASLKAKPKNKRTTKEQSRLEELDAKITGKEIKPVEDVKEKELTPKESLKEEIEFVHGKEGVTKFESELTKAQENLEKLKKENPEEYDKIERRGRKAEWLVDNGKIGSLKNTDRSVAVEGIRERIGEKKKQTREEFKKEAIKNFKVSEKDVDNALTIYDSVARNVWLKRPENKGKDLQDFYAEVMGRINDLSKLTKADREKARKGDAEGGHLTLDGKSYIFAFNKGGVKALAHEAVHVAERFLTKEQIKDILEWSGQKEYNEVTSELLAKYFERYLGSGKAPTKKLKGIFEYFKDIFKSVFKDLKDRIRYIRRYEEKDGVLREEVFEAPLEPKIEAIFDKMLGVEKSEKINNTTVSREPFETRTVGGVKESSYEVTIGKNKEYIGEIIKIEGDGKPMWKATRGNSIILSEPVKTKSEAVTRLVKHNESIPKNTALTNLKGKEQIDAIRDAVSKLDKQEVRGINSIIEGLKDGKEKDNLREVYYNKLREISSKVKEILPNTPLDIKWIQKKGETDRVELRERGELGRAVGVGNSRIEAAENLKKGILAIEKQTKEIQEGGFLKLRRKDVEETGGLMSQLNNVLLSQDYKTTKKDFIETPSFKRWVNAGYTKAEALRIYDSYKAFVDKIDKQNYLSGLLNVLGQNISNNAKGITTSPKSKNYDHNLKKLDEHFKETKLVEKIVDAAKNKASYDVINDMWMTAYGEGFTKVSKTGSRTSNIVPKFPKELYEYISNPGKLKDLVNNKANTLKVNAAVEGNRRLEYIRDKYVKGEATSIETGELLTWGLLSSRSSVAAQEQAFQMLKIPRKTNIGTKNISDFIDLALQGKMGKNEFTALETFLNKILVQESKGYRPKGYYKSRTHEFDKNGGVYRFIEKLNNDVLKNGDNNFLNTIHKSLSQDKTGSEIRRDMLKALGGKETSIGIRNKIASFVISMTGRNDLIILDTVQSSHLWGSKKNFQGKNVFDGGINRFTQKDMNSLFIMETLENAIKPILERELGEFAKKNNTEASVGLFHWLTYNIKGNHTPNHRSLDMIYDGLSPWEFTVRSEKVLENDYGGKQGVRMMKNGTPVILEMLNRKYDSNIYSIVPSNISRKLYKKFESIRKEYGVTPADIKKYNRNAETSGISWHDVDAYMPGLLKGRGMNEKEAATTIENFKRDITKAENEWSREHNVGMHDVSASEFVNSPDKLVDVLVGKEIQLESKEYTESATILLRASDKVKGESKSDILDLNKFTEFRKLAVLNEGKKASVEDYIKSLRSANVTKEMSSDQSIKNFYENIANELEVAKMDLPVDAYIRQKKSTILKGRVKTFRKTIKEGGKIKASEIKAAAEEIKALAKEILPKQMTKGEVGQIITRLSIKDLKAKDVVDAHKRFVKIAENFEAKELKSKSTKILNATKPRKGDKSFKKGKFKDVEWNRHFDIIRQIAGISEVVYKNESMSFQDMAKDIINDYINNGKDMSNVITVPLKGGKFIDISVNQLKDVGVYAGMNNLTKLSDIKAVHDRLANEYKMAKEESKTLSDARAAYTNKMINDVINTLTGHGTAKTRKKKKISALEKNTVWAFDSFGDILERLGKHDKNLGMFEGPIYEFHNKASRSLVNKEFDLMNFEKEVSDKQMEIYGSENPKEHRKKLKENMEEIYDVKYTDKDGVEYTETLSQNQLYKIYQWTKDPSLKNTFDNMGWTKETFDTIESLLKPEVKEFAEWQMEHMYPKMYDYINPKYRERTGLDLERNPFYTPLRRLGVEEGISDVADVFANNFSSTSVFAASTKGRIKTVTPFDLAKSDGDAILMKHLRQATHFVNWSRTVRDMRAVFNNYKVQEAIRKYHGEEYVKILKDRIDSMAADEFVRAQKVDWLDTFRRNSVYAKIGLNPVVFIKQLTSFPAYGSDISAKDFISGVKDFFNPMTDAKGRIDGNQFFEKAKFLMENSKMMQVRYKIGHDRDISDVLKKSDIDKLSGAKNWTDTLLWLTKQGDKAAIVMGGWGVYKKHYNAAKKSGLSEAEAVKFGIDKFERATERAQQSYGIPHYSELQMSGSWGKVFTMFKTSPIQYNRLERHALRNLYHGKGNAMKNLKTFTIAHFVLPGLFQYISDGLPGIFSDWDEEKKVHMIRTGILGSYGSVISVMDAISNLLDVTLGADEKPWSSVYNLSPLEKDFTQVLMKNPKKIKSQMIKWAQGEDIEFGEVMDVFKALGESATLLFGGKLGAGLLLTAPKTSQIIKDYGEMVTGEQETHPLKFVGYTDYALGLSDDYVTLNKSLEKKETPKEFERAYKDKHGKEPSNNQKKKYRSYLAIENGEFNEYPFINERAIDDMMKGKNEEKAEYLYKLYRNHGDSATDAIRKLRSSRYGKIVSNDTFKRYLELVRNKDK